MPNYSAYSRIGIGEYSTGCPRGVRSEKRHRRRRICPRGCGPIGGKGRMSAQRRTFGWLLSIRDSPETRDYGNQEKNPGSGGLAAVRPPPPGPFPQRLGEGERRRSPRLSSPSPSFWGRGPGGGGRLCTHFRVIFLISIIAGKAAYSL